MKRTLTLVKGRSFRFEGRVFLPGEAEVVENERIFLYLMNLKKFKEHPPLGYMWVVYRGNPKIPNKELDSVYIYDKAFSCKKGVPFKLERFYAQILLEDCNYSIAPIEALLKAKPKLKILIVRNMGLGDVLMVSPIFKYLKSLSKTVQLDFMTYKCYFPVFRGNPYIDNVVPFVNNFASDYYDAMYNLCNLSESSSKLSTIHRAQIYADELGVKLKNMKPTLILTDEEKEWAKQKLQEQVLKLLV